MGDYKSLDRLITKYLLIAGVIIIFLLNLSNIGNLLKLIFNILLPIIIGFCLAYVVNILMESFEKIFFPNSSNKVVKHIRRPICILLAYLLIGLVIYIVMSLIIPQLYSVIVEIIRVVPYFLESIRFWLENNDELLPQFTKFVEGADVQIEQIVKNTLDIANNFTSNILEATLATMNSAFVFVVNSVLSIMISLYVLMSKDKLINQFDRSIKVLLSDKWYQKIKFTLSILNDSFKHFITGQVLEAFITGITVTIGMWIFRFPFAAMIGALTGFTALLPMIGAYISGAIGFLLIFVQSPFQGLMFIIFIIVIQQLEGNLVYPKVVGNSIGLPGLWVLIAITIGGGLWGVTGMLLAVPLASAFYRIFSHYIIENEKEAKQSEFSDRTGDIEV